MARIGQERSFGFVMATAAGLLGLWALRAGRPGAALAAGAIGASLAAAAVVRPAVLRTPARLWMAFAARLGAFNARILLSLLFVFVMTPVGWIRRWRRDPLGLDRRRYQGWVKVPERLRDPRHFERLF